MFHYIPNNCDLRFQWNELKTIIVVLKALEDGGRIFSFQPKIWLSGLNNKRLGQIWDYVV